MFSTLVHVCQALKSAGVSLNQVIPAYPIQPGSRAFLLLVRLSKVEFRGDDKVRNWGRVHDTLGKSKNRVPVGEGQLIMFAPSLFPLTVEGFKDIFEVADFLVLGNTGTRCDALNISQPNLVKLSMYGLARLASNPNW